MKILQRHMRLLSGIVLMFVAASSSGFMTVIYTCSMATQCCMAMDDDACQTGQQQGTTVASPFRCITTSIAGSPSTLQGFLQSVSSPLALSLQFVLPADVQVYTSPAPATFTQFSDTSPPPGVETYLLTQTLLI